MNSAKLMVLRMKSIIKLFVMDVDGTLTDGKIYMGNNGELMKAFNVKDGYAISQLITKQRIIPIIITGRESRIIEQRAAELGIVELYQGVEDKISLLKMLAKKYNTNSDEIAYIGDDVNDLECINFCKFTACPADAHDIVKPEVSYICSKTGGNGAVREFIDWIEEGH